MDYKELYFELYGEIADLIEQLKALQQKFEDKYIEADEIEQCYKILKRDCLLTVSFIYVILLKSNHTVSEH